jgi:hypothetical protein
MTAPTRLKRFPPWVPSSPAIRVMALAASYTGRGCPVLTPNRVNGRAGAWQVSFPPELPGRAVCPALGPGDGGHRGMPRDHQGQALEPTKVGYRSRSPTMGWLGVPSWLAGALAAGVGHASTVRPDPSTRSVVGERGSHRESRLSDRLKPPEPVSAQSVLEVTRSDLLTIC